jgi:hypothetical protein
METHHFWAFFIIALLAGASIAFAVGGAVTGNVTLFDRIFGGSTPVASTGETPEVPSTGCSASLIIPYPTTFTTDLDLCKSTLSEIADINWATTVCGELVVARMLQMQGDDCGCGKQFKAGSAFYAGCMALCHGSAQVQTQDQQTLQTTGLGDCGCGKQFKAGSAFYTGCITLCHGSAGTAKMQTQDSTLE